MTATSGSDHHVESRPTASDALDGTTMPGRRVDRSEETTDPENPVLERED